MVAKSDYGIEFVNVEIKFALELIADEGEILGWEDLGLWIAEHVKNFAKFGFGYNERSNSYTVSYTEKAYIKPGEKPPCLTQHGKTPLSALQKCYFLVEVCGGGRLDVPRIENVLGEREDYLQQQLAGLLKKRP